MSENSRSVERLRRLAENAVDACLPVLPLNGSATAGYEVNAEIPMRILALPEEWADAAQAIADLHRELDPNLRRERSL